MQLLPKPLPRPKPLKRSEVGRRMTIALGILASDGIVIAADSQETYGDYFKAFALKIHRAMTHSNIHSDVKSAIVITGSGASVYLDAVSQEIIKEFHSRQHRTVDDLELHLKQFQEDFWAKHVTPLLPHIDRQFELIIGAEIEGRCRLWRTDANVIKPSESFEAVGTGHSYARMAIERHVYDLSAQNAAILAVLGVMRAKEYDNYCGKSTMVTIVKENRTYTVPWYLIEQAEKLFRKYAGYDHSAFVHALASERLEDSKRLQNLNESLTSLRAEFTQLAADFLAHPD